MNFAVILIDFYCDLYNVLKIHFEAIEEIKKNWCYYFIYINIYFYI